MSYRLYTLHDKPELADQLEQIGAAAWPEFLRHGDTVHWSELFSTFAAYQLIICDPSDTAIAVGYTVPLVWDGTVEHLPARIDDVIVRALEAHEHEAEINVFSALAAMILPERRGQGLSSALLREMKSLAGTNGARELLAPVRPTWKQYYPLTPMNRYVRWTRDDNTPFDPWLRTHWRLGARGLGIAPSTLTVTGTVAEWESWTGMAFPDSGHYVVPGALQPVVIDREEDLGHYDDPNYWMAHRIG